MRTRYEAALAEPTNFGGEISPLMILDFSCPGYRLCLVLTFEDTFVLVLINSDTSISVLTILLLSIVVIGYIGFN